MRQNFINDPFKPRQDQHTLPISPQNFDPLDKPREHYPQKRPIFSSTPNKPKTLFEAISEVDNPPAKGVDSLEESDLKKMLSKEMSSQLEGIKNEILDGFTALLKGTLNPGQMTNKDVQDMKRQMVYNKNKFEEIQDQIGHLNQQYSDINNHYTQEIKTLRTSASFQQGDHSGFEEDIQSQIESQLQNFKQDVLSELHNTLSSKTRSIRNDDVINDLNQIKYSFEGELKNNFEVINGRVKKAEENLNELMRRKRDYMDSIRTQTLGSAENQNRTITQEINQVSNMVKSKYEQTQVRVAVNAEINRRADSYRAEVDSLRKAIMFNQSDVEEMNTSMNRKLEGLDNNIKRQIFDLKTNSRNRDTSGQRQDVVEMRIQKLSEDSEGYYNTIHQLRSQLDEVMKTHRLLQNQASTPSSKAIISKLEDKIFGLQNHIREIESEIRRQQPQQIKPSPKVYSPNSKLTRSRLNDSANLEVSSSEPAFKTHRVEYRSPFETDVSAPKERKWNSYQPQEEKLSLPDFNGGNSARYNGDPKVKSIIDEFQQKKSQTSRFSPEKTRNVTEKPRQFESLTELSSFRDPRKSHFAPPSTSSKSYRDLNEAVASPLKSQKSAKFFETEGDMGKVKTRISDEIVQRPQILVKKASMELANPKKIKHAKILSQINYFIYGTVSNTFDEEEDSEIYCNLDDNGYIFDEDGDFVLDSNGNKVKLTPEQIEKFNNNNMIE